jgi:hypothetical protein
MPIFYALQDYLALKISFTTANLFINGSVCPDEQLMEAIGNLRELMRFWLRMDLVDCLSKSS